MVTIVHGPFAAYTPVVPPLPPLPSASATPDAIAAWQTASIPIQKTASLIAQGVAFVRGPDGSDWYDLAPTLIRSAVARAGKVVSVSSDATTLSLPTDAYVVETDDPLVVIGWIFDGTSLRPYQPSLVEAKTLKLAAATSQYQTRCEAGAVQVTTSAGTYQYGIDNNTRRNVSDALLGVTAGIAPSPRPWTPKGQTSPITITTDDLKLIAGKIGAAYDAIIQAYLVHKGHIMTLTDATAVAAYDVTVGWP